MKRLIFIILLSIAAVDALAQERHASFATNVGIAIPVMNTPASTAIAWQISGYYHPTARWSVGAGTGLSFYEKTLAPLFGDIRYQIGRQRRITPYAEAACGYSFALSGDANGGLFLNPSLGVYFPLAGRVKLQLAVGYELQKLARLKTYSGDYFHAEFSERLNHQSISIRVGLRF